MMALPTFALAEAPLDVPDDREMFVYEGGDIVSDAVDESYEEAGELSLGGDDAQAEDEAAPLFEEEPQDAVATWWFIVDDTLIAHPDPLFPEVNVIGRYVGKNRG